MVVIKQTKGTGETSKHSKPTLSWDSREITCSARDQAQFLAEDTKVCMCLITQTHTYNISQRYYTKVVNMLQVSAYFVLQSSVVFFNQPSWGNHLDFSFTLVYITSNHLCLICTRGFSKVGHLMKFLFRNKMYRSKHNPLEFSNLKKILI